MIVGNKSVFGFEYKITDNSLFYGNGRIWFGGNPICTFEDETHLIHLINGLKKIRNSKKLNVDDTTNSIDRLFNELIKRTENIDDERIHDYVINFGTSSDDFLIFSYSSGNDIHVLWKIMNNKSVFDDINSLPKSVYNFKIKKIDYDKTMAMIINKTIHGKPH